MIKGNRRREEQRQFWSLWRRQSGDILFTPLQQVRIQILLLFLSRGLRVALGRLVGAVEVGLGGGLICVPVGKKGLSWLPLSIHLDTLL